jgi:transcriptional regulator with XRE-family HTH domain
MTANSTNRPRHYLRKWREVKTLTQEELANKAGTYKSIISRIETGKHGLELALLFRLTMALDILPGQLFQDPDRVSLDFITRDDSDEQVDAIAAVVRSVRAARAI